MTQEFFKAFFLIFVAEMGDKTQILAMTFATRYNAGQVFIGIFLGVILNHSIAILLGTYVSNFINPNILQVLAGILFIIFGLWALINSEDKEENKKTLKYGAVLTVASAFFIGELGDKTQLTAMTLSMDAIYPAVILIGTVTGMLVTSCMGIFIGTKLGDKVSGIVIQITSGIIFIQFGIIKLFKTCDFFIGNENRKAVLIVALIIIAGLLISRILIKNGGKNENRRN